MNPGRGATRLGNDAMPIWVDIPRWLVPTMREAFRAAGITYELRALSIGVRRPDGLSDGFDRFIFRDAAGDDVRGDARARAAVPIQQVVDSVPESRPPQD